MKIALIVLNDVGLGLARRLQPTLDGAVVHGLAGRADMADLVFHMGDQLSGNHLGDYRCYHQDQSHDHGEYL